MFYFCTGRHIFWWYFRNSVLPLSGDAFQIPVYRQSYWSLMHFMHFWFIWHKRQKPIYNQELSCVLSSLSLLALLSVNSPFGHRFNYRNFISCACMYTSLVCAHEILGQFDLYLWNGSHFSFFMYLALLSVWLIIEPSNFTQICTSSRPKWTNRTGSLWPIFFQLLTFFTLSYVGFLNPYLSKASYEPEICVNLHYGLSNELRSTRTCVRYS